MSSYESKLVCEEIKKKHDLLEYIKSKGLQIIDKGGRYFCLCPFHSEKTPSMCINKSADYYWFHCFGCKKKGTIIDFYMEYEKVELGEAISRLSRGFDINVNLADVLKDMDVEEEEDIVNELNDANVEVSINCFNFLRRIRGKVSEEDLYKQFESIESFYENFDEMIENEEIDKVSAIREDICNGDFLTNMEREMLRDDDD